MDFLPGDIVVASSDECILWKHGKEDKFDDDEILTTSLSASELMLVISVIDSSACVVVASMVGYVSFHRLVHLA